jgi:hypothetical protein
MLGNSREGYICLIKRALRVEINNDFWSSEAKIVLLAFDHLMKLPLTSDSDNMAPHLRLAIA